MNYGTSAAEIADNIGLGAIWDVLALNSHTTSRLSLPALHRDRLAWLRHTDAGYRTSVLSRLDETRATLPQILNLRRTTSMA